MPFIDQNMTAIIVPKTAINQEATFPNSAAPSIDRFHIKF
jgi:hypothetical protein